MVLKRSLIAFKCFWQIFHKRRMMMKKLISALILTALLLSSILAIVPASAADAGGRESIIVNSRADQMAGVGPSFYYNYHLYEHEVALYPLDAHGKAGASAYMLRSRNAANGSASFMNGDIESWSGVYNDYSPSDEKGTITDKDGKTYDFDAWCGISIRDTATVSGFSFYTTNESTKGSRNLIEELMLFGAVVDPELHTYAPNSWFPMTELITDVQATYTDDGKLAYVTGDFDEAFDIDYLFMALNMEGDNGGSFTIVEIELYEDTGDHVDIKDLDTKTLQETLTLAEEPLANEKGFTATSYATFLKAYNAAKKVAEKDKTTQEAIDRAATTLYNAITNLVPVADTTGLESEIAKCEALVEADYTVSTWATLATALNAAKELLESGNASEAAIAEHIAALTAATEALGKRATEEDIAALQAKVDEVSALDDELYTQKSFADLRVAMRDANILIYGEPEDVSTAQCEEAIKKMDDAAAALVDRADIEALKTALTEALAIDSKLYTTASFEALSTAMNNLSMSTTGQTNNLSAEEGAALLAALESAKAALVKAGDVSAVGAKIAELEKIASDEYTAESWKALTDAIAAAKALQAGKASEADVASALEALDAAQKGLAVKPAPTEPATQPVVDEGGCGGVISVGAVVIVAALGFGITALKRR